MIEVCSCGAQLSEDDWQWVVPAGDFYLAVDELGEIAGSLEAGADRFQEILIETWGANPVRGQAPQEMLADQAVVRFLRLSRILVQCGVCGRVYLQRVPEDPAFETFRAE